MRLRQAMQGHVLANATLMGAYRKRSAAQGSSGSLHGPMKEG
jgi:hypothetical protein